MKFGRYRPIQKTLE